MLKHIIWVSIGWCCCYLNNAKAQYIVAGTPGAIYQDIVPDSLLQPSVSPGAGIHDMYYYIDINQDASADIEIHAKAITSPGAYSWNVEVSSLNSFTAFSLGSIDSTYTTANTVCSSAWITRNILKIYNNGDTIKNANYISAGYLGFRFAQSQCQFDIYSTQWLNIGDVFLGVRYQTGSDTAYGWVKVNVTAVQNVLIKEFSLGSPVAGVNSNNKNNFIIVYPNPAIDKIYIEHTNNDEMEINLLDIVGKQVGEETKSENPTTEIDVSGLSEGVYFMKVSTNEGVLTKKIVVAR